MAGPALPAPTTALRHFRSLRASGQISFSRLLPTNSLFHNLDIPLRKRFKKEISRPCLAKKMCGLNLLRPSFPRAGTGKLSVRCVSTLTNARNRPSLSMDTSNKCLVESFTMDLPPIPENKCYRSTFYHARRCRKFCDVSHNRKCWMQRTSRQSLVSWIVCKMWAIPLRAKDPFFTFVGRAHRRHPRVLAPLPPRSTSPL